MGTFSNLLGTMSDLFHIGGPSGPAIQRNGTELRARDAANLVMAPLSVADATTLTQATTYLQLQRRDILVEFSFNGSSPPAPATVSGQYGMVSTSGLIYNAGEIWYSDGTTLTLVPIYKMQTVMSTTAFAGTVSMIANGVYISQFALAPFGWTLKGDGAPSSSGVIKYIQIAIGTAAATSSTTNIPVGSDIRYIAADIDSVYDAGATLVVTVGGQTIMAAGASDLAVVDSYQEPTPATVGTSGPVLATIANGPTLGSGRVTVGYVEQFLG